MTGELQSKALRNMCHSRSIDTTTVWRNMNYLMQNGKPGNTGIQKCGESARKNSSIEGYSEGKIDIMIKY